jgi:hypothetical protein
MIDPLPISITVSDPWDVGEAVNWKPIDGELLQLQEADHGGKALVRFDHEIVYRGAAYRYAVAAPRLEGGDVAEIEEGKTVGCALTGISQEQARSSDPMDTSKWRGGLAFIGDIKPLRNLPGVVGRSGD